MSDAPMAPKTPAMTSVMISSISVKPRALLTADGGVLMLVVGHDRVALSELDAVELHRDRYQLEIGRRVAVPQDYRGDTEDRDRITGGAGADCRRRTAHAGVVHGAVADRAAPPEDQLHAFLGELGGLRQLRGRRAAGYSLPEHLQQGDSR